MKQEEFLQLLMSQLIELNEEDKNQLREYYNELIMDGMELGKTEDEIINEFGPADQVAARIRKEYAEYGEMLSALPSKSRFSGKEEYRSENTKIHTIIIDASNIPVDVIPVREGSVKVDFKPRDGVDTVSSNTIDGEFTFIHRMRSFSFNFFSLFQGPRRIVVEVPEDFEGNLSVKTTNGSINVKGLKNLSNAKFLTSNAKITAINFVCKSVFMKTSNGSLNLDNIHGDEMEAETSNAHIAADSCAMSNALMLTTKNGAIGVHNIECDKIVLKTSNAAITGTIHGDMRDYAIQSHTSNASCNLPNYSYPEQKKNLVARTSNGRIQVEFVR